MNKNNDIIFWKTNPDEALINKLKFIVESNTIATIKYCKKFNKKFIYKRSDKSEKNIRHNFFNKIGNLDLCIHCDSYAAFPATNCKSTPDVPTPLPSKGAGDNV